MRTIGLTGAIALVVGGIPVSSVIAAAPAAQEEPQREKKICRSQKMTGSLTRRTRICLTEAEWRELNDRTRRGVNEMQNSASGAPNCISTHDTACGTAAGPGGVMPGQ